MHSDGPATLLKVFLDALSAQGLGPDALDPWRGWLAFKQFARSTAALVDPGVSVQVAPAGDRQPIRLYLLRQVVELQDGRSDPVGGVVCEFVFAPRRRPPLAWQEWSFEFLRFEDFVDAVERTAIFADLVTTAPLESAVYWEEM